MKEVRLPLKLRGFPQDVLHPLHVRGESPAGFRGVPPLVVVAVAAQGLRQTSVFPGDGVGAGVASCPSTSSVSMGEGVGARAEAGAAGPSSSGGSSIEGDVTFLADLLPFRLVRVSRAASSRRGRWRATSRRGRRQTPSSTGSSSGGLPLWSASRREEGPPSLAAADSAGLQRLAAVLGLALRGRSSMQSLRAAG